MSTLPDLSPGLGLGLDLPWSGPHGIVGDRIAERTLAFVERYGTRFSSVFVSWQPRDRGVPRASDVETVWDALFERMPHAARCLHHTALNLAAVGYDRSAPIALANALAERFGLAWVNEDLGLWSVGGRPLPYPRPPPLTAEAVDHCARVCAEVDRALDVPLVVEMPGYEGRPAGDLDAYDAFREIVERSGCACNLDTGHLLTWRQVAGHRGEALLDGLERLPLAHCVELHCAGIAEGPDGLLDAHHGVLPAVQLALLDRLIPLCPNLRRVTFEDPRPDEAGVLPADQEASLQALEARVDAWIRRAPSPARRLPAPRGPSIPSDTGGPWDAELHGAFAHDTPDGRVLRGQILDRRTRGVGRARDLYASHLAGADEDALLRGFVTSAPGLAWSDVPWAVPGLALEDALGRFLAPGSPEHLTACARLLAVHPDPPFAVPDGFARGPHGWWALGGTDEAPILVACARERLITGPVTPAIARVLRGDRFAALEPVRAALVELGLV